ncbi:MAG TPA: hypothetical protein VGO52_10215 [Hyphomonadaceae bacterium]|nr:hypothetical protein [Hyphomonadaceae bacterium]
MRWLACIAAILMAGCSPADPVCKPKYLHCGTIIDVQTYWTKLPTTLAPDEVVVEASLVSTSVIGTHAASTEYANSIFGEHQRACTLIRPIAVHVFHVRKVVQGAFEPGAFVMTEQPGGCNNEESSIRLGELSPPAGDAPAFLVIRPTPTPPEIAQYIPWTGPFNGPENDKPLPVMTWRNVEEARMCSSPQGPIICASPAARP